MQLQTPFLTGFTFIKNGLSLGYPIKESIESIAPLCDEVIINVGFDRADLTGDDGTYDYLRDHFPQDKFVFLKSHWDPNLTRQGLILSQQTNIALSKAKGRYCQYIQGDEALHEQDYSAILEGIKNFEKNQELEGLVFKYIHFYGNVDVIQYTRRIYRREVRLFKNLPTIKSYLDAQGFRHDDGRKLNCQLIDATVYHYGWARKNNIMKKKIKVMDKLYHGADFEKKEDFEYKKIWGCRPFKGTHPQVMTDWITANKNDVDILKLKLAFNPKDISLCLSDIFESITNYRIGEYKNYKLI